MTVSEPSLRPRVLVVDDEALIRMFAADIATDAGYEVVEATNTAEALRAIEADDGIGIVFTDINMPGALDGLAMAHQVRDRWPPVRFLVVSGHRVLTGSDMPGESRFFAKPYGAEEIAEALDSLAADWRRLLH